MLLSVVIVSYNTQQLTLETLASLTKEVEQSLLLQQQTEIIVVDNNSQDGSVAALKKISRDSLTQFHLILNRDNRGFAAANNQALRKAHGQFVLLLNSDTIVKEGSVEKMVQLMIDHPVQEVTAHLASHHGQLDRLGILAARLENPDGALQPQGGSLPSLLSLATHMLLLDDLPIIGQWLPSTQHTGQRATAIGKHHLQQQDWVGGTAMLLRREMLDEIDLLDENIFMYGEDVELCMRARFHHWDIAIATDAPIVHYGSASSSSSRAIEGELKGYLYIWSKHQPSWQVPIVKSLIKLGCHLRAFVFGTIKPDQQRASIYRRLANQF